MKIRYRFVDQEGDEMNSNLFRPNTRIPVRIKSVEFVRDDDPEAEVMVMTLVYLHDSPEEVK